MDYSDDWQLNILDGISSGSYIGPVFVPLALADYLKALSISAVEAYARALKIDESAGGRPVVPEERKARLIETCRLKLAGEAWLGGLLAGLERPEASALKRLAIEHCGILPLPSAAGGLFKPLQSLVQAGLALRLEIDGRESFVLPFEVLVRAVAESGWERDADQSLLIYLLGRTKEVLGFLAARAGFPSGPARKSDLLREYYARITSRFGDELKALDERRRTMLRELLRHGGIGDSLPMEDDFYRPGQDRRAPPEAWPDGYAFHRVLWGGHAWGGRLSETPAQAAALDLVALGFVIPWSDPMGRMRVIPMLSRESMPAVREHFLAEMRAGLAAAEKRLPAPPPKGPIVTYADRVLEDILKLRVAAACGRIEVKKDGSLSRRSVKAAAGLLRAPEVYVEIHLLGLGLEVPEAGGAARLPGGLKHPVEHFRELALKPPPLKAAIKVLDGLPGWLKRSALEAYLDNHPVAAPWMFRPRKAANDESASRAPVLTAKAVLNTCFWYGLIESAAGGEIVRPTGIAGRLDEAERDPAWDVVRAKDRPVRVQANLEILVPLTAEPGLFGPPSEFAELAGLDRMVRFVLTRERLIAGLDAGWTPETILAWLERPHAAGRRGAGAAVKDQPAAEIPATVRELIASTGRRKGEAAVTPCQAVIRCEGIGVKERILALPGVDAAKLDGAEDAPYLAVFQPPPGELVALLKKKKIFADFASITEPGEAAASGRPGGRRRPGGTGETNEEYSRVPKDFWDTGVDPGPKSKPVETVLAECLRSGTKVKLAYMRGYRWKKTNLVTIIGLRKGRVYFIDREGLASSLDLDSVDSVIR